MPRPTFDPTSEQLAIVDAARTTPDNLLVAALAGAAKTSTLELLAWALKGSPILSVAFNKKIAEEMTRRLPSHCQSQTLNSIGHRSWGAAIGKRLTIETDKTKNILRELKPEYSRDEQEQISEFFVDICKLVGRAKLLGYVPPSWSEPAQPITTSLREDLYHSEDEWPEIAWQLLDHILTISIRRSFKGLIDFDDQVYMSTCFHGPFPRFPLVLVDEAQDLSPLNHAMVEKLTTKRLIAVGDHYQAIYAFRGAASNSMGLLRERFNMRELGLSVSFRCPINVVKLARSRAPHMQWSANAEAGDVRFLDEWSAEDIPQEAAIICRLNAPLLSCGLRLLRAGRGIDMKGFDISKRLIKLLEELGPPDLDQQRALIEVQRWRQVRLEEAKSPVASIEDRAACLRVFIESAPDLRGAVQRATNLFAQTGPIQLMSGHKSKGLEFDHVFHLDRGLIGRFAQPGTEAYEQEKNIEYVITTRAKKTLTHIELEMYQDV